MAITNVIKYYFIEQYSVIMKGKDLFTNIQDARNHINRLKKEAEMFNSTLNQSPLNIHEYVNQVVYSLSKNQQEIQGKHNEFKNKLPSIHLKKEQLPIYSYKKQTKQYHPTKKHNQDDSTKIDNNHSFSLIVQNRPLKMHSFQEKHVRAEFPSEKIIIGSETLIPDLDVSTSKKSASSQFRRRHFEKKSLKFVDLNKSSSLVEKEIPTKMQRVQDYTEVIDKHSLHEFMIIKGKLASQTPQFLSFQRIYESIFPKINENIAKLQELLTQNNIDFARLNGKKLAYLCLKQTIQKHQLIGCLVQSSHLRLQLLPEERYAGRNGKVNAVNKIISFWKMKSIRDKYLTLKKNTIFLQRYFQRQLLMLSLEKNVRKKNDEMVNRFEERQAFFAKEWKNIKHQKRIQIHLNSIEVDEEKRLTIENFAERQNIQLSRIFRLKDDNLIIIYISSVELSLELISYYYRMMELAGITNYRDRLILLTPSEASKFPAHFSANKLLYYSSRTLNQLKIITSDLPTIIYPGHPSNQLIKICDFLNCYLFSGEPQKMKGFTTKSQTKRLLKNLCIETLPGTMEMYDYGEFLNTFSVLILKNPEIDIWVLKIDDQFGGRGIASVDFSKSKVIKSLLRKSNNLDNLVDLSNSESQTFATDIASDPQNQEITVRIRDYLKDHLQQRLQIATSTLYRCYEQFMGRFIKKGGVIEAHPPCSKENLTYPSVSFCLEPDGEFKILTTYEKIMGQSFRGVGCSFPQRSIDISDMNSICRQICESFKIRNVFGNFTIDLICYRKNQEQKFWVIDIDPYINDYTSSFYIFDLLMQGSFFPEKNMYLIESDQSAKSQKYQTRSVDTMTSELHLENQVSTRDYIFVPHFFHKNLMKVKIKQFFKQARMEQFNFDIANKEGLCILLLDQLASGVMGLLSVAQHKSDSIEMLCKVLEFVAKISDVKNVDYGKSGHLPATDAINLKDILSVFATVIRKNLKKNAKERAIRKYQMSQNLQLL